MCICDLCLRHSETDDFFVHSFYVHATLNKMSRCKRVLKTINIKYENLFISDSKFVTWGGRLHAFNQFQCEFTKHILFFFSRNNQGSKSWQYSNSIYFDFVYPEWKMNFVAIGDENWQFFQHFIKVLVWKLILNIIFLRKPFCCVLCPKL